MNRTRKTKAKAEIKTSSSVARDQAVVRKSSAENGEVGHTELTEALRRAGGDTEVIPVVEESLRVGRRSVETGKVRSKTEFRRKPAADRDPRTVLGNLVFHDGQLFAQSATEFIDARYWLHAVG